MGSTSADEDIDVDVDDMLLELVEDDGHGRKHKRARTSAGSIAKTNNAKRRKEELTVDTSEGEPESEEDEANPYPLEGRYKNEADRQSLLMLSEVEREQIISARLDERQKAVDRLNLTNLIKSQRKRPDSPDEDRILSSKRKRNNVGKTQEKTKGLAALTEKRRMKQERDAQKDDPSFKSSRRERRDSSASISEESEDGEYGGDRSSRNRNRRANKFRSKDESDDDRHDQPDNDGEKVTLVELGRARITRDMLAKYCHYNGFEDFVKGGWVRYNFGPDPTGRPCYRLCEIIDLGPNLVAPYNVDNTRTNKQLELRHGSLQKCWNMDRVSNAEFPLDEFESLVRHLTKDSMRLPKKSVLERKREHIIKFSQQALTEKDVQAILSSKSELNSSDNRGRLSSQQIIATKARLNQRKYLAQKTRDEREIQLVTKELAELEAQYPEMAQVAPPTPSHSASSTSNTSRPHASQANGNAHPRLQPGMTDEATRRRLVKAASTIGQSLVAPGNSDRSRSGTPLPAMKGKLFPKSALSRPSTPGLKDVTTASKGEDAKDGDTSITFDTLVTDIDVDIGDF